ncbi:MAG: hypothetical protein MI866_22315 [Bacteroidales bacterium]|nr:hypothetical protein [Bacteroidales bacterium]
MIHVFDEIRGGGRIILANDNFPVGDASHFNSDSGQGTVVYVGNSLTLDTSSSPEITYYNIEVELDNANDVLTLVKNCTLINSLVISRGDFRINDDVSTTPLKLTIKKDVHISTDAKITVGKGNTTGSYSIHGNILPGIGEYHTIHHRMTIGGNLHNEGELLLTNRTYPIYNELADDGAVVLEFDSETDSEALLEGPGRLYSLIINKGNDKTYQLDLEATNENNLQLLGPNCLGRISSAPYSEAEPEIRKSLWIQNGTLKLSGKIHIPTLSEGTLNGGNGDFAIGQTGRLWLASADVKVYTTAINTGHIPGNQAIGIEPNGNHQAISVYGELLISAGLLHTRNSAGVIFWGEANGQIKIQGGKLETGQIRSQSGASGVVSYIQTFGEVIVWGNKEGAAISSGFPLFGLDSESSVFQMSGGSITFKDAHDGTVPDFRIVSAEGNYLVNGGSINIELDDDTNFDFSSSAPVYDITVRRYNANHVNINNSMLHAFQLQNDLVVLRDLVLETPDQVTEYSKDILRFLHNGNNVTIGRNFIIERGATYEHHAMSGYNNRNNTEWLTSWSKNTTTFNGTENGTFYYTWFDHPSHAQEQVFWNLTVDKQNGASIRIECDDNNRVVADNTYARLMRVMGKLHVENGILDQGNWGIRAFGPIVNKGTLCTYEHGVTRHGAYLATNISNMNIQSSDEATFGYIKLEGSSTTAMTFTSDIYIKRLDYKRGNINLGAHKLTVDHLVKYNTNTPYLPFDEPGFANSDKMIYTSGNASDGGLRLKVNSNQDTYVFPIGCNGKYTPATIQIKNSNIADGYITIVPVDDELQTTNLSGGDCLSYYWKVDHDNFTANKPSVELRFKYNNSDLAGTPYLYVAGRVLNEGLFERWYEDSPNPDMGSVIESSKEIVFNGELDNGFEIENANYTAGRSSRFTGSPEIYYLNTANGINLWSNPSTWTKDRDGTIPANDYPKEGDVAIIQRQGSFYSGLVTVKSTINVGSVVFDDRHGFSGGCPRIIFSNENNYAAYASNFSRVEVADSHTGTDNDNYAAVIQFDVDEDFNGLLPGGDFEAFNQYEKALIIYGWNNAETNAEIRLSNVFVEYPSLWFSGGNNNRIIKMPDTDIKVNGDMTIPHRVKLLTGQGHLDIAGHLRIGHSSLSSGQLIFSTTNTAPSVVNIEGDLLLRNTTGNNPVSSISLEQPGTGTLEHRLNVYGNIQVESQNCELQLGNGTTTSHIILSLSGEGDHHYSSVAATNPANAASTTFSKIIVDKGGSQLHSFSFDSPFRLGGETNGLLAEKAFSLESGSAIFNNPTINLALNSGGDDFRIPGTAALVVNSGTLSFYGDDCGIYLDGQLKISSTPSTNPNQPDLGVVFLNGMMAPLFGDAPGNGNNYIEYSASGNAELILDGGMLRVGSQIRRPVNTEEGILKYTQSSASGLIVGEFGAPVNNRGVFEILNVGSSYTQTEGDLLIYNSQDSPSCPAFYFDPETINISDATNIIIGQENYGDNLVHQFDLFIKKPIKNLSVTGENTLAHLVTVPLSTGNLSIGRLSGTTPVGATLNANGLNITLSGDFLNYGAFEANDNTTSFSSTAEQIIGGTSQLTFSTLKKEGNNTLSLDLDITIDDYLKVNSGILSDNGHSIHLKGHVLNTAEISHLTGADGLVFNGTEQQFIEGNGGVYGKVYIDNWDANSVSGVKLTTNTDSIVVRNEICLKEGVFDIGENLLVMATEAGFTEVNSYSTNNMVQTNASFTDSGIKKYFADGGSTNFTYPIGSGGKYTPVVANISAITGSSAAVIVKAANEMHPSIQEDTESPDYEIVDQQNALKFYWSLKGSDITDFTGHIDMYYEPDDVLISNQNGSDYDIADYIPARLIYNQTDWNKFDWADFEENNGYMRFTYSGVSANEISGDYTAGVQPNTQSRNGAIPDNVPIYESVSSGLWSTASTWQTVPAGGHVPSGGPAGAQVIINSDHIVDISQNYKSSYKTIIYGELSTGTTFGNRLGIVEGTGVLKSESEILPAGFYEDFFSKDGGTLEYAGINSYDILNNLSDINSLKLSGTGQRRFPNVNLNLKGDLIIDGDNADLLCVNEHNRNMSISGDISFDYGRIDWGQPIGLRNPSVELAGNEIQYIIGEASFTNTSAFNDLYINNSNGVIVQTAIDVGNNMQLQQGVVKTNSNAKLTLLSNDVNAITGGGSTTFIEGPIRKMMHSSQNFTFPIGYADIYAPFTIATDQNSDGIWEVEYYKLSPENHSRVMDVQSFESPLEFISRQEFWRVLAPSSQAKSFMTFRWGNHSGVNTTDMALAKWRPDNSGDIWTKVLCNNPVGANASGSITTTNSHTAFDWSGEGSYFTFASNALLAYSWLGTISNDWFNTGNWSSNEIPTASANVTINNGTNYNAQLNGNVQVNDLNIISGELTVKPGSHLTINGNLDGIDKGLIIENSNINLTSLIAKGTVAPLVSYKWSLPEMRYWYIGVPLSGIKMEHFDQSLTNNGNAYVLHQYNGQWRSIGGDANYRFYDKSTLQTSASVMEGYSLNIKDAGSTLVYEGYLNTANSYTRSFNSEGWYLIGNPYSSYLDISHAIDFGSFNQTAWVRTDLGNNSRGFATYNILSGLGQNGGTKYIVPGQSFWLRTYSSNDRIIINSTGQLHSQTAMQLKSSRKTENDVIRLTLDQNGIMDELVIAFRNEGKWTVSPFDSEKRMGDSHSVNFYSYKGGKALSINVLPTDNDSITIPLAYHIDQSNGNVLSLEAINTEDWPKDWQVILNDKRNRLKQNLCINSCYSFDATTAEDNSLELLLHKNIVSTDITQQSDECSEMAVTITGINKQIAIKIDTKLIPEASKSQCLIYDMHGRLIYNSHFTGDEHYIQMDETQVVLVKVFIGDNCFIRKLVI